MSTAGMLQRCWEHDYCAPSFYMITVVTEPRRGCLSRLNPEPEAARDSPLTLSPMGEMVRDVWLLMLAPFPHHRDKRTITREQCLTLNEWALAIAERDATDD